MQVNKDAVLFNRRLPDVTLGTCENGNTVSRKLRSLIGKDPALIVGVPKAFTPICTRQHLPGIIANFHKLKSAGLKHICVIAPDNAWAMAEWKRQLGAPQDLLFLADGNHTFIEGLGLKTSCEELFIGPCSMRYTIQVADFRIKRIQVEESIFTVGCTSAENQLQSLDLEWV